MKPGAEAVARTLGRSLVLAFVLASLVVLGAHPETGGALGGFLLLAALVTFAVVFGVAGAVRAAPPKLLQTTGALAVIGAGLAGVFLAPSRAFDFVPVRVAGMTLGLGDIVVQAGALVLIAGAGGAIFLCLAGRAEALLEDDSAP